MSEYVVKAKRRGVAADQFVRELKAEGEHGAVLLLTPHRDRAAEFESEHEAWDFMKRCERFVVDHEGANLSFLVSPSAAARHRVGV